MKRKFVFVVSFFITFAAFLLPSILLLPSRRNLLLLPLPLLLILLMCITFHLRETSLLGEDSRCRGSIVNIRVGCSCAHLVRPNSSTALWRFRASTSNSLIGRKLPHPDTPNRQIYHICAQQDIRVYEDYHFQPQKRQYPKSKALCILRVSI